MKLYELTQQYTDFERAVANGEIPDEAMQDTLDGINGQIEDKADSIACIIKDLLSDAEAIKAEQAALAERSAEKIHRATWLKDYLSRELQAAGKTKIETPRNVISFRKSTRLVLDDDILDKLSETDKARFLRFSAPTISKTDITKAVKAGETVPGAHLEDAQNIQIK